MSDAIKDRDSRIVLNLETHTYYVDGKQDYISVSRFKELWFPMSFNMKQASESHLKYGVEHERSDMTPEEVEAMWTRENNLKRDKGIELHGWIDDFYTKTEDEKCVTNLDYLRSYMNKISEEGLGFSDIKLGDQGWYNFIKFVICNQNWELIRSEWRIFHDRFKLAGTLDALFKIPMPDGSIRIVICDWKRVKRLIFDAKRLMGDTSKVPGSRNYPSANYWAYHIQLNLYRIILEDYYNIKIDFMMIIRLSECCKNFKIHLIEKDDTLRTILESRLTHFDAI
jgi:hypothetical protein